MKNVSLGVMHYRYGLVGFGSGTPWGHSHLLDVDDDNGDGDSLFGTAEQLKDVVEVLSNSGSYEEVWDAIEHTVQEYEFRPGAAVIFVAFRRDDIGGGGNYVGNEPAFNAEHTHHGTLAAMKSYNVTLNTVIEAMFDPVMGELVLGVEADGADGVKDGRQQAHVVNPEANQPTPWDALLASYNGTNSGTYVDSGKSIRISRTAQPQIVGPSVGDYRAQSTAYAFEDIASTGTRIADWSYYYFAYKELAATDLGGFTFNYYGTNYSSLFVNADGSITFGGPSEETQDSSDWTSAATIQPRIAPL